MGGSGVMWSAVVDLANLISLAPNGSLTLHVFRPEHFRPDVHAATYKCSALNSVGRILSTPVRVRAGANLIGSLSLNCTVID